jgi:hypothetical protein
MAGALGQGAGLGWKLAGILAHYAPLISRRWSHKSPILARLQPIQSNHDGKNRGSSNPDSLSLAAIDWGAPPN